MTPHFSLSTTNQPWSCIQAIFVGSVGGCSDSGRMKHTHCFLLSTIYLPNSTEWHIVYHQIDHDLETQVITQIIFLWNCGISSIIKITIITKITKQCPFNSLAPERFQFNSRQVIFKQTLVNGGWGISYEIALRWMPLDLADDNSTLVQVMDWCRQATSHYLNQHWPRSPMPYDVARPQWVKHPNTSKTTTINCSLVMSTSVIMKPITMML